MGDRPVGPLAGIRVLDLTHVLNGPFCTMLLAHMGADVIKVEHGAGDRFRHSWMPSDAGRDGYESLVVNANKRCVTLNLKDPRGGELFGRLVAASDVVVENFSVGVMDRLGYGYHRLKEINPRIVYARSSGYGNDGPYAGVPAFAVTIMAMSGWTDSAWNTSGHPGSKPLGMGDEAAGVSMALGICAALVERERTGSGTSLDVSMQEAQMGFMVSSFHTLFEKQEVATAPAECLDGFVSFHMPDLDDRRWSRFCVSMGHPEGIEDPQFLTPHDRRINFDKLMLRVREWVRERTRDQLWETFRTEKIPGAPVLGLDEVIEDDHIRQRGAFVEVEHPQAGTLTMLRPWIRFDDRDTTIRHAGPGIGEHNQEVYGELLGLSVQDVDRLTAEGVL
ncbi:CoA transferase [Streptomyces sp. NBC_00988]|uniref:CaiB/BaiF CoA transferase family protein n=1 Tax=Streptomyces sp. NBC_00988 TaxID=2903704 RepID=UPI0038675563|nr:CoA transferase [Streptomyces sp. NBC_00988]